MRLAAVARGPVIVGLLAALLGATLFAAIALAPAAAQQGELSAMHKRFNELYAAGNYSASLVEAQKLEAFTKSRFGTNHLEYARAIHNLALLSHEQGNYGDAEELYKRAIAIKERTLGINNAEFSHTLGNLGTVYLDQSKYAEAEKLYRRVLAIEEKAFGAR
jgi:tetratricopeptide (TPR) repeat protein